MRFQPVLRAWVVALCAIALLACGKQEQPASAESAEPPEIQPQLREALNALGQGDMAQARELLPQVDRGALPVEQQALRDRIEAHVLSDAGEHAKALEPLQRALVSGGLSPGEQDSARFDVAWLYNAAGQPERAVEAYRVWQASHPAELTVPQLLAMSEAYAGAKSCSEAADLIAKAYKKIQPEERIDVAAALEIARPLCPEDRALTKLDDLVVTELKAH